MTSIQTQLTSPDAQVRGRAMQELLLWARKDPSIHASALPIFEEYARKAIDPWTSVSAACGVHCIAGREAAGAVWRELLNHPKVEIARHAAMAVTDPAYVPDLLQILQRSTDLNHRQIVLRALGRLRDESAFESLVAALKDPQTRADTIEALGDLYDFRAIPFIKRYLDDHTQTGFVDNHGPPLRISDIAGAALSRIKLHAGVKSVPPIPPGET